MSSGLARRESAPRTASGCVRSNRTSITTPKASTATPASRRLSTVFVMSAVRNAVALDVQSLTVRYGDVTAVDSVSFVAHHGQVTAVLGRNGAGKTSVIEACEGLRRTHGGSIALLGADARHLPGEVRAKVGVMLQDGGIAPAARVRSTVRHYCALHGRGADADQLIALVGLQHRETSSWRRLSGGERQRFSLALALAAQPEIAFLDEPSAGLDLDGREMVRTIISNLVMGGASVVLATHDLDEAERVADRVVVLHRGRVVVDDLLVNVCSGGRRLEDAVREVTR